MDSQRHAGDDEINQADDLTAERAAQIVGIIDGLAYIDPNDHRKCEEAIRPMIQQVRQEALQEAAQQLRDGAILAQSRDAANALNGHAYLLDRLASKGADNV